MATTMVMTPEQIAKEIKRLKKLACCNSAEILISENDVSGSGGTYKLAINKSNGNIFYKDVDGNWQPIPSSGGGGGNFIPLSGTEVDNPVTGTIKFTANIGEQAEIGYYGIEDGFQQSVGDGSYLGQIIVAKVGGSLNYYDYSLNKGRSIASKSDGNIINDDFVGSRGLIGNNDFTPNITDLDYTQKKYVDDLFATVGGLTEITRSELDTLISNEELTPGAFYKISGVDPDLYNDGSGPGAGGIITFTIVDGGANYNYSLFTGQFTGTVNNVPLTDGTGNSATADLNIDAGIITSINMVNAGLSYRVGDLLTIENFNTFGSGSGFQLEVTGITGPTSLGTTIIMQAATTNSLCLQGHGIFYTPKYDIFPIWNNLSSWIVDENSITGQFLPNEEFTDNGGRIGNLSGSIYSNYFTTESASIVAATNITGNISGATANVININFVAYPAGTNISVAWGGYVWKRKPVASLFESATGTAISPVELSSDIWIKAGYEETYSPDFENIFYFYNKSIDVIHYDYGVDQIIYRADKYGNKQDVTVLGRESFFSIYNVSPIQVTQWGNPIFTNNKISGILWDTVNSTLEYIKDNTFNCTEDSVFYNNKFIAGNIQGCIFEGYIGINDNNIANINLYSTTFAGDSIIYLNNLRQFNLNDNIGVSFIQSILGNTLSMYANKNSSLTYCNIKSQVLIGGSNFENGTYFRKLNFDSSDGQKLINIKLSTIVPKRFFGIENNNNIISVMSTSIRNLTCTAELIAEADLALSTYFFNTPNLTVYNRPDTTVKLMFMNDSDNIQLQDITD